MKKNAHELPLIYSCSGVSNCAQLANQVAIEMHRERVVEMSCIAGVGGGVETLVKKANSGRPVIGLDGCPLHCVKKCLALQGVELARHYTLTELGYKKRNDSDVTPEDVASLKEKLIEDLRLRPSAE